MTRRRPPTAPEPPMSDRQHAAITTELVRLAVGPPGPDRPELETPEATHPDFRTRRPHTARKKRSST